MHELRRAESMARPESDCFDVAVIGAGLSGLTVGLHLQRAGLRVLILERRPVAGGLCGTFELDGREFVVACNDFGRGMEREMRDLGVQTRFEPRRTRFHLDSGSIDIPPDARALLRLARSSGDFLRLAIALLRGEATDMASFVETRVHSRQAADLLGVLAYPMGRPPSALALSALRTELSKQYAYGYDRPTVPLGGPGALVRDLVERFEELGGTLVLDVEASVPTTRERDAERALVTTRGTFRAGRVVSSEGRWSQYPEESRPGLSISTLHLAVRRELAYPAGFHTLVHVPPRPGQWLEQLDRGEEPSDFGFHVFKSDLPDRPDHYTLNAYVYFPRGVDRPDKPLVERVERYFFDHAERILPGLRDALLYCRFVSSAEFVALHGLSPRVARRIPPPGFEGLDVYEAERDLYHVGNSVHPPGDHAGAAILSARLVAERILSSA